MVFRANIEGKSFKFWLVREDEGIPLDTYEMIPTTQASGPLILEGYVVSGKPGERFSVNLEVEPLETDVLAVVAVDRHAFYCFLPASTLNTRVELLSSTHSKDGNSNTELKFADLSSCDPRLGIIQVFFMTEDSTFTQAILSAPFLNIDDPVMSHIAREAVAIFKARYRPRAALEAWGYIPVP